MFAGLTHEPAVQLATRLAALAPGDLNNVFYLDSGSVAVEAAIKMAIQYQYARGQKSRRKLFTLRGGYHGDTLGAMALCDPEEGMHGLFRGVLTEHIFGPKPTCRFDQPWEEADFAGMEQLFREHADETAAVIVEPIFQGASGMWFYSPEYLRRLRALCDRSGALLIFDEIATGFGRTGKRFAAEHAGVIPDIMTIGKALTGGVITLAAAIASDRVARTISEGKPGVFMHGPTFMANPLACAAANASLELFDAYDWQRNVRAIEAQLKRELEPARELPGVADVRVLGAIGVIEMKQPLESAAYSALAVENGVWLRPFGKYLYTMPPFICTPEEISRITGTMKKLAAYRP